MIIKLKEKNLIDILELTNRVKDDFSDFFITKNRERKFINNIETIKYVLKKFECFGIYDKDLSGIAFVYHDKGFRYYIKFLSFYNSTANKLIQHILWHNDKELFIKIKKENKILKYLNSFSEIGSRGKEILLKSN